MLIPNADIKPHPNSDPEVAATSESSVAYYWSADTRYNTDVYNNIVATIEACSYSVLTLCSGDRHDS